jgi:hypothetical protein
MGNTGELEVSIRMGRVVLHYYAEKQRHLLHCHGSIESCVRYGWYNPRTVHGEQKTRPIKMLALMTQSPLANPLRSMILLTALVAVSEPAAASDDTPPLLAITAVIAAAAAAAIAITAVDDVAGVDAVEALRKVCLLIGFSS